MAEGKEDIASLVKIKTLLFVENYHICLKLLYLL